MRPSARDRQHAVLGREPPRRRRRREGASGCILARIVERICALFLLLLASPHASAGAPSPPHETGPLAEARRLLNEQGQKAAVDHATAALARTDLPRAERFELALFTSTTLASIYRLFPDDPPGDPIYLCKALTILDAAAELAEDEKEQGRHRKHRDARQRALEQGHPGYRCEATSAGEQDGLMSVPTVPHTLPRVDVVPRTMPADTAPTLPQPSRLRRRALALTAIGGTSLGLGVASLAAMAGALAVRNQLHAKITAAGPTLTPIEDRAIDEMAGSYRTARQVALVSGVVGSVILLTGVTMVARGSVLSGRIRALPDLGSGRAALTVFAQF